MFSVLPGSVHPPGRTGPVYTDVRVLNEMNYAKCLETNWTKPRSLSISILLLLPPSWLFLQSHNNGPALVRWSSFIGSISLLSKHLLSDHPNHVWSLLFQNHQLRVASKDWLWERELTWEQKNKNKKQQKRKTTDFTFRLLLSFVLNMKN